MTETKLWRNRIESNGSSEAGEVTVGVENGVGVGDDLGVGVEGDMVGVCSLLGSPNS